MDLPPELWLRIGKDAVAYEKTLCINHQPECAEDENADCAHSIYYPEQPAICRVSKTLRRELLPIFYHNNTFHALNDMDSVPDWLKAIEKVSRKAIHSFYLTTMNHWDPRFNVLCCWAGAGYAMLHEDDLEEVATRAGEALCCAKAWEAEKPRSLGWARL